MIVSFADKDTGALFAGVRVRRFISVEIVIRRKLVQLHAMATLDFICSPPGNRLEALRGDRAGQFSNRVNDQFRICFKWDGSDVSAVEIVDYH